MSDRLTVRVGQSPGVKVLRSDRVQALRELIDVDVTTNGQYEGSILKYDVTTRKWTSSQIIDCGEF